MASNVVAFVPPQPNHRHTGVARGHADIDSRKFNFFENIGSMISNFGKKASASHILIGPKTMNQDDARKKLEEIKAAVGNDPEKFAKYASEFSTCPSSKNGGDLGSFGPGMMVKNFDKVSTKASLWARSPLAKSYDLRMQMCTMVDLHVLFVECVSRGEVSRFATCTHKYVPRSRYNQNPALTKTFSFEPYFSCA